jgi:tryptophan synthase beta subunit
LKDIGCAEYVGITDAEALEAFHRRTEGIAALNPAMPVTP